MKGWFDVARISCSARARLILLRLIISFLLNTIINICLRLVGGNLSLRRDDLISFL